MSGIVDYVLQVGVPTAASQNMADGNQTNVPMLSTIIVVVLVFLLDKVVLKEMLVILEEAVER